MKTSGKRQMENMAPSSISSQSVSNKMADLEKVKHNHHTMIEQEHGKQGDLFGQLDFSREKK